MKTKFAALLSAAVWCSLATTVHADLITAYEVTAASYQNGHAWDQSFGNSFTPTVDLWVMTLGFLDIEHDGLAQSHEIGIFRNSDESLLVSTVLNAGLSGTLVGDFRYVAVTPTLLQAGVTYMMAAHYASVFLDKAGLTNYGGISFSSEISPVGWGRYQLNSFQLEFPDEGNASNQFNAATNFQFSLTEPVPEPASLTLFAAGALALGCVARWRCGHV